MPQQKAIVTGNDPTGALQDVTLGKDIPLFIGGQALIGARAIEGPFLYTEDDVNLCDMIVDLGIMASPEATRELEGNQRSTAPRHGRSPTVSWSGLRRHGSEFQVWLGDQTPFASSIARLSDRGRWPIARMPVLEIKKIPLAVFNNVVPWSAGYLYETASITRNAALTAFARYLRFDNSEFEFDVSGTDAFWIAIKKATMMQYFQDLRATIGRNWNITTSDKLRIFENSAADGVTFDITRANTSKRSISLRGCARPGLVPPRRGLGFVDTERDNDFNTVFANSTGFRCRRSRRRTAPPFRTADRHDSVEMRLLRQPRASDRRPRPQEGWPAPGWTRCATVDPAISACSRTTRIFRFSAG
jgi:hypothetical protein